MADLPEHIQKKELTYGDSLWFSLE